MIPTAAPSIGKAAEGERQPQGGQKEARGDEGESENWIERNGDGSSSPINSRWVGRHPPNLEKALKRSSLRKR